MRSLRNFTFFRSSILIAFVLASFPISVTPRIFLSCLSTHQAHPDPHHSSDPGHSCNFHILPAHQNPPYFQYPSGVFSAAVFQNLHSCPCFPAHQSDHILHDPPDRHSGICFRSCIPSFPGAAALAVSAASSVIRSIISAGGSVSAGCSGSASSFSGTTLAVSFASGAFLLSA